MLKIKLQDVKPFSDAKLKQEYWLVVAMQTILVLTVLWLCILMPLIDYQKGSNLPRPDELHYSEGILKVRKQKVLKGADYEVLSLKSPNKPKFTEYYCGYSARHYARNDDCFFKDKKIEDYIGQQATIGWYYQDRFLWMKNPHPQLVTLSVGDQQLRTYQETKGIIDRDRKGVYFDFMVFAVIIGIPCGYLYYILARGTRCIREELSRRKGNVN